MSPTPTTPSSQCSLCITKSREEQSALLTWRLQLFSVECFALDHEAPPELRVKGKIQWGGEGGTRLSRPGHAESPKLSSFATKKKVGAQPISIKDFFSGPWGAIDDASTK